MVRKWPTYLGFVSGILAGLVVITPAAAGTVIIYFIVEKTVGFRLNELGELEGLDKSLHGESGYGLIHSDLVG